MFRLTHLFLVLFLAISSFVSAQDLSSILPENTEIDFKNDSSQTVKPADLIIAYEETSQMIRDISNDLLTDYKTAEIEQNYESVAEDIQNYIRIGERNIDNASLSRIDDLIIIFERLSTDVESWQNILMEYSKELSNSKIEILKNRNRLEVNMEGLDEDSENYYNARFGPAFEQVDSLEVQIDAKLAEILELEYHISGDYMALDRRIEVLKSLRRDYWVRILKPGDFEWKELFQKSETASTGSEGQFSSTIWRIATFFMSEHVGNTIFALLLIVAVFLLIRHLKSIDTKKKEGEHRYPILYAYPIAQALLIGGILFPVIYPPTTTLMYDFALLVTYIPFLWILYHVLGDKLFRKYLVFFAFFLAMKLINLLMDYSLLAHVFLIVCGVVFLLTLIGHSIREKIKVKFGYLLVFNWMLRIVLVVGLILILLKRLDLGRLLINGAGETIAISLVLIFFANWLDQLIEFIKERPYIQRLRSSKAEIKEYFDKVSSRIYLVLFVLFIIAVLRDFTILGPTKDALSEFFMTERSIGQLQFTYSGIVLFFLVLYISTKLSATIKFFLEDKSYFRDQKKTANIAMMIRFFLVIGGFMLALLVSGIPLDKITIILGALSVGIGFGLQNIVNNLISGIILIFERPIQSGDLVELQQYMGVVKDIGIRSSIIRTYDGAEIIVPNGNLISQEVINWTLSNQHRRIEIRVGVAYGSNTEQVPEVLAPVILNHDKVLKLPQPMILFDGFGESSLDFRLLFWTSDIDNWLRTRSEVTHAVYQALNENKIEIPFPQRDLHVRTWDKTKAIVPQANGRTKTTAKKTTSPQEK